MGESISNAGRAYAKTSMSYDRASYELELAERGVKDEIEGEVRRLLDSIIKKHGVRVTAIFPHYMAVLGEGLLLTDVDIDIESSQSEEV